jgi:aspartate kinase
MRVLHFGGGSLATASRFRAALDLVVQAEAQEPVTVVVSALGGVSDSLDRALARATSPPAGNPEAEPFDAAAYCRQLRESHRALLHEFLGVEPALEEGLDRSLQKLDRLLRGVALLATCPAETRHRVLATGPRLAAPIFAAALSARGLPARVVDGTESVITDSRGRVDTTATAQSLRCRQSSKPAGETRRIEVFTGSVGADRRGSTTTLGSGGSELSAALVAGALGARRLEIWTDADGVLSGDPRHLAAPSSLPVLSYSQAAAMARFGAKVLHPGSLDPVARAGIPVRVANTLRPDAPGTWIGHRAFEVAGWHHIPRRGAAEPAPARFASPPPLPAVTAVTDAWRFDLPGVRALAFLNQLQRLGETPLLFQWNGAASACILTADAASKVQEGVLEGKIGLSGIPQEVSVLAVFGPPPSHHRAARPLAGLGHLPIGAPSQSDPSQPTLALLPPHRLPAVMEAVHQEIAEEGKEGNPGSTDPAAEDFLESLAVVHAEAKAAHLLP